LGESDLNKASDESDESDEMDMQSKLTQLERENRRLNREIDHMKHAIAQEKTAYTTILNQQKASTFIMRERERYLMLLLANSPSIILFLSQTGRVEFCTDYFVSRAGYKSAADVTGRPITEIFAPFVDDKSHAKMMELGRNVIQTNMPVSFDTRFSFKQDGTYEDFDGLIVPMNDEQNDSKGLMLLLHNTTDLIRSREEALAASKAKSSFLSNMSHEIRTPMNAIIGMTSIGKNEKTIDRMIYAFEKIETAGTHLLGVINDILDISKIEAGKMELSYINFSFTQMIDRVASVVKIKIQDKKQHFSLDADPDIPKILFGDDQRLAQVIANLLSNATKFTSEGGSIELAARLLDLQTDKCVIQVSVKDSGIGMSKEEQGKLFSAFQQAEAGTSRKFGGTGLGLVISKSILEMMDGDIRVESEPGKGSCFIFTASLGVPEHIEGIDDARQVVKSPSDKTDDHKEDFSGRVILLVDDVEINLEIAMALLEPTNITIDTAIGGKESVDAFAASPGRYDLILMDMQMPGIDGLQATRMIRAMNTPEAAAIPIIAMTANVFKEDIQKCLDVGMNGHLGKPIEMNEVLKVLSCYFKPD